MKIAEKCIRAHAEDLKIVQKVAIVLCAISFISGVFIGIGIGLTIK